MKFIKLNKLKKGDKVAVLSPSFAAPAVWPHIHELGLKRLQEDFELVPVEFPTTRRLGASKEDRAKDLIAAFKDKSTKAIITSIGGDDQVTYIKNLPNKPFKDNPKPFFGFSDNTHMANFLWLNGIPSYYGGALFTQFAMQVKMDTFTVGYLKKALFEKGEFELNSSRDFNEIGLDWSDTKTLNDKRALESNDGWFWDGNKDAKGISWGGCLESIDEMLRHGTKIPSLKQFKDIVLFTETSEEIPEADYVYRVYRALGERGILANVKAILVGRPKAWHFNKQWSAAERKTYREKQREVILKAVRQYNKTVPVIQNLDFGHTDPQISFPYGRKIRVDSKNKKIFAEF